MTIDALRVNRDNVLSAIRESVEESRQLQRKIDSMVAAAREFGASWQQIGDALGMSRQAAWERYGAAEG